MSSIDTHDAIASIYLFPNFVDDSFKLEELSAWIQDVSLFSFNSYFLPHKFIFFLLIKHSFTLFLTVSTLIYILNLNKNIFFHELHKFLTKFIRWLMINDFYEENYLCFSSEINNHSNRPGYLKFLIRTLKSDKFFFQIFLTKLNLNVMKII